MVLEGVAQVLPLNVEEYAGGAGGMHMMMDFLGGDLTLLMITEMSLIVGKSRKS